MRKRKIKSVQIDFRVKRQEGEGGVLFSVNMFENLYDYIVLGYSAEKSENLRKEKVRKNRHPGRKDKYAKRWGFERKWE